MTSEDKKAVYFFGGVILLILFIIILSKPRLKEPSEAQQVANALCQMVRFDYAEFEYGQVVCVKKELLIPPTFTFDGGVK